MTAVVTANSIKALQALAPGHRNSVLLSTGFHKRLYKTFSELLLP